ncbi:MAG TPA: MFS transporter [Xanthobacteraceae bacterium]|nr:MFS transporter [Xanthobacteraceae bacterium]
MSTERQNIVGSLGGVTFHNPGAFWFAVVASSVGVLLHLPMYIGGRDMGYRLAGMPVDTPMLVGMFLITVGLIAAVYGLYPPSAEATAGRVSRIRVRALDDAPMRPAHVGLLIVMAIAVTIDVMKPTTLAFVVPGMAQEYGLRSPLNPGGTVPVAYLPLSGITGTVLGSFLWGWLGDRIGRRAAIMLAGIIFISTSICGSMPDYFWNFVMCFIMGLGVGGMLPIAYALMAETIPARHRGWLMVLIGGDIAAAYIITSWLASSLVPDFSWRILWLLGAPTGLMLILLNRWIPESPRYLLAAGRDAEARAVMERYGARVVEETSELEAEATIKSRWSELLRTPLLSQTTVVALLGIGSGLVLFGFNLWIPTNLRKLGFTEVTADRILRDSALIGFPFTFVVAWLYGFWSSKKTIILLTTVTAAALFGFTIAGDEVVHNRTLLYVLLVIPIWGINTVTAVLAVYSSEIYPTRIRSRGTGLAAGASKAGGVMIIAFVVLGIAAPSIATTTLVGGIPMALAAIAMIIFGVETRKRSLEEITAQEFKRERVEPAQS